MWNKPSKTKEPDNREKAYEYAVFLLSLRLRSMGELRGKMEQRGYSAPIIDAVVEQLRGQRYLDDERYAEIYLENLKAYRNIGYYGIKKKLLAKKLPTELIDRMLNTHLTVTDELAIARRLLKKEGYEPGKIDAEPEEVHYKAFGNSEESKDEQKKAQRLKARGFRGDVIAKLLY